MVVVLVVLIVRKVAQSEWDCSLTKNKLATVRVGHSSLEKRRLKTSIKAGRRFFSRFKWKIIKTLLFHGSSSVSDAKTGTVPARKSGKTHGASFSTKPGSNLADPAFLNTGRKKIVFWQKFTVELSFNNVRWKTIVRIFKRLHTLKLHTLKQ